MNGNHKTASDWNSVVETFAAELTEAAYPVLLRHGVGDKWLDLELDLWKVLTATLRKQGRTWPRAARRPEAVPGRFS